MPAPSSSAAAKQWTTALFEDRGAGLRHSFQVTAPTIPTAAGNTDAYVVAPEDGSFHSLEFSGIEALAANDTNYIQFTATNLGTDGLGTTVLTSTAAVNSTKVTGGAGLVANGRRVIILSASAPLLRVKAGDRIRVRITGNGTLANTVTGGVLLVRFNP